jgi:hypothetical protein
MNTLSRLLVAACVLAQPAGAWALSSCSSDGQPRPTGLLERFINADCAACWTDARVEQPRPGDLALDWIVPGGRGDDAPLSAAANRDATSRLEALRRPVPAAAATSQLKAQHSRQLRVSHGIPFRGYVGTSMELKPGGRGPWRAWLLLVETVPAGTEGTPVARHLVRNVFRPAWDGPRPPSQEEQARLHEARVMSIPEGVPAERLSVVGWVEDAQGRIRGIAQSRCGPPPARG